MIFLLIAQRLFGKSVLAKCFSIFFLLTFIRLFLSGVGAVKRCLSFQIVQSDSRRVYLLPEIPVVV